MEGSYTTRLASQLDRASEVFDRVTRTWEAVPARAVQWVGIACGWALLAWIFYEHAMAASMVIDGVRWFWLDDDQMISMRYARNLVEGHGLVWNPGERVEGYTNPLWTLLMAAIHLTPLTVQHTAVAVEAVNFLLCCVIVWQAVRLLAQVTPGEPRLSALAVPLVIAGCWDVVFWATNGFETTLLTALNLVFLTELLSRRNGWVGWLSLALIPVVRGDGMQIWAANMVLALLLSDHRPRTLRLLALSLLPALGHLTFRRLYYEEWLPNTYYLKAVGLQAKHIRGFHYARNFLIHYAVPCCLAVTAALATLLPIQGISKGKRAGWALLGYVGSTLLYCILVGGDSFAGFRFFAHAIPVIFVFAAAGSQMLARGALGHGAWLGALCLSSFPLLNPVSTLSRPGGNGDPFQQVVAAALLNANALPGSSIAVIPAGMVPYYTGLPALDILGKNDKYIARLPYRPGSLIAHGKLDPEYTLALEPDFVISCRSHTVAASAPQHLTPETQGSDYVMSFLASDTFRKKYLPNPVSDPFLAKWTQIYAYAGSPEADRRKWHGVMLGGDALW